MSKTATVPKPFSAANMRALAKAQAYHADSPVIKAAVAVITDRIRVRAREGKFELIYPFDGIDGNTGALRDKDRGWGNSLNDEQIRVIVVEFEKLGFVYHYAASQDPGSPGDRELHVFKWS